MMENVLRNIFSGKTGETVHNEFIKFSRGIFENRYLIYAKKQKDRWNIKAGYEFANFFVRKILEKTRNELDIRGIIVFTGNLEGSKISIERIKQFMGVKQYIINTKVNALDIIYLMDKYPKAFFALSMKNGNEELKIKAKAPKGGKPSNKGGKEVKADFCSLKTSDKTIVEDLFFDFPIFNEIKVKHTVKIDEIIIPRDIDDPVKMREMSKRKGKIIREINADGRAEIKEAVFEA